MCCCGCCLLAALLMCSVWDLSIVIYESNNRIAVQSAYQKILLSCDGMWSASSREKTAEMNAKFLKLNADCNIHHCSGFETVIYSFFCPFMSDILSSLSFLVVQQIRLCMDLYRLNVLIFLWQFLALWKSVPNKVLE